MWNIESRAGLGIRAFRQICLAKATLRVDLPELTTRLCSLRPVVTVASRIFQLQSSAPSALNEEWSFFVTPKGYISLAVSAARHDDDLCIALGASVLVILRRRGDGSCYTFVGEAYVHGLMNGEAIKLMEEGGLKLEQVDIV
ncbi:hypothetical protein V8F33_011375 [Rhypophila sp. PSN 637]